MKKIGILTYFTDIPYFNDINPGMDLQAYSVYKALCEQYPNDQVELIRYHSWFAIWRIYISSMTINSLFQDFVQFWKYYKFQKKWNLSKSALVSSDPDKSIDFIKNLGYDAIYVGSDTLLELFRAKQDEITAYWLHPKIKSKKFMVAASARDTSFGKLSDKQKEKLNTSIDSFNKMGVRDAATYDLIEHFTMENDDRLSIIPDPTFFLDIDHSHAKRYLTRKGILSHNKPIICFHLLKDSSFASQLADSLRDRGYIIVSLRPAKYADYVLKDLSPLEFSGIFNFFELTFTHRFHDSVFSIKNLTPVLLFLPGKNYQNEKGHSKQSFLMESFGLKENGFISDIKEFDHEAILHRMEDAKKDFESKKRETSNQLEAYKKQFVDYLETTKKLW